MKLPPEVSAEYPFKGRFVETASGARLHYLDEGKGEGTPVLMLHGNPSWSFLYRNLVLALREDNRCLVPDHLGCGLSDKPAYPGFSYDLASHVENLRDLLEGLGVEKVRLVVHDWGGAIGFGAFRDQPERVESIVILNTAAFPSSRCPFRIRICRYPFLGALLVRGFNGFAGPAARMAVHRPLTQAVRQGFLLPYDSWANRVAVWRFVRDIPLTSNHPSMPLLKETGESLSKYTQTPALACWGGRDFCFNEVFLREWQARLPQLETNLYEDAGHYVLEDAGEKAIRAIQAFLG
ncbi:MAG: alpha/beta hydrolase [Opitutae bacterium]|nr:alpha/beta hydrolase [Opitutae bacterium]